MAIAFAIAAALCFGASGITTARGIQNTNLVSALLVSLSVTAAVAMAFVLIDIPQQVSIGAVALFVAAGLLGDGVGRASFFRGVDRLGPSTTTPILTASYPLIAFVGGILLFSEAVTIWRVLGAACIVAGIWALTGTRDHFARRLYFGRC